MWPPSPYKEKNMWINIKDGENYLRMVNMNNVTSVAYNKETNISSITYTNNMVTYVDGNIFQPLKRALPANETSLVTIEGE